MRRRDFMKVAIGGGLALSGVRLLAQTVSDSDSSVVRDVEFGVRGDGVTNEREILQRAIDSSVGKTLLLTKKYRIDVQGLTLRTGSKIIFSDGASIKLLSHSKDSYQIVRIWDVNNVSIVNARLDGSKELCSARPEADARGYGMGISIAGARDVLLVYPKTINCWGDGIYIGNSYKYKDNLTERLRVVNHFAYGCRRQGVSIISGRDIEFDQPHWENIGGTLPSAGLDVEPNGNNDVLEKIRVIRPFTKNCKTGILIWLKNIPGVRPVALDISILNHVDVGSTSCSFNVSSLDTARGMVTGRIESVQPVWHPKSQKSFVSKDFDPKGPAISIIRGDSQGANKISGV